MNVGTIGSYIREQREQAKISLRQLAQAAGVSNPYLSQIERGLRRPSADILQQIAKGLRISAEALYVQAGFLEDRGPGSQVRDAVLTDTELTERQKQMLLEIYDSFRKQTVAAATGHADDSDPALSAALGPRALTAEAGPGDPWADPDAGPFADSDAGPWADPDATRAQAGEGDGGGADGSEFPSDQANR
ncbi:MAG TPA: helix-turn-helix transcriptional regulator [Streptosporangiaceae bacterium]